MPNQQLLINNLRGHAGQPPLKTFHNTPTH